ncbi:MAG: hypothetical protein WBZ36_08140 [Candidatus Nitrosopolaris sp.]
MKIHARQIAGGTKVSFEKSSNGSTRDGRNARMYHEVIKWS